MPPRPKGPRLYWHEARRKWVIRDTGRPEVATGTADRTEAEKALARYITARDRPSGPSSPDTFLIADALDCYGREHAATVKSPERIGYAIEALLPFWGALPVSAVKGETCRRYAKTRTRKIKGQTAPINAGTIRRELGVLRAALTHCEKEGYLTSTPEFPLPDKPPAKDRWLTRAEAARLLWAAYRSDRGKHLSRYILVGLYTGTRKSAILGLQFRRNTSGGWVDVENGLLYRRASEQRESKKRQPPARLPNRLLAHLRRWKAEGAVYVVEYQGGRIFDVQNAFEATRDAVGLHGVSPHTLRHTAITWAMQRGARSWDVSSYFGVSVQTIESTYGHHSPYHQATATEAMNQRG